MDSGSGPKVVVSHRSDVTHPWSLYHVSYVVFWQNIVYTRGSHVRYEKQQAIKIDCSNQPILWVEGRPLGGREDCQFSWGGYQLLCDLWLLYYCFSRMCLQADLNIFFQKNWSHSVMLLMQSSKTFVSVSQCQNWSPSDVPRTCNYICIICICSFHAKEITNKSTLRMVLKRHIACVDEYSNIRLKQS